MMEDFFFSIDCTCKAHPTFISLVPMSTLCTLNNITIDNGHKQLFKSASLAINESERVGLLGLNGQGKSTLLRILMGEVAPDHSTPPFNFDKFGGEGDPRRAYRAFYIPQDLTPTFKEKNCARGLPKVLDTSYQADFEELDKINHQIESTGEHSEALLATQGELLSRLEVAGAFEFLSKYESYLRSFGLDESKWDVPLSELSGGEAKKTLLSLGLASNAPLILWDEPTNHLDIETIDTFEDLLLQSKNAFILVTHDRYLLSRVCSRILTIEMGRITSFQGGYEDYLVHLEDQGQMRARFIEKLHNHLRRETAWMRQGIKARGTRSKKRVETYEGLISKTREMKSLFQNDLQLSIGSAQKKSKQLIKVDALSYTPPKRNQALFKEITLTLLKGEKIGLLGPNGCGKTTLLKLITGALKADKGDVKIADDLKIQFFDQYREDLPLELTPYDVLGNGSDQVSFGDGRQMHVAGYFEKFLFNRGDLERPISTLSGGERARLHLARNLTKNADLWIFDEPTNDLDLKTLEILEGTLADFSGSLIVVSHDRAFLSNVTDKIWLIDNFELKSFEAGYAQASGYLEAIRLERELEQENNKEAKQRPEPAGENMAPEVQKSGPSNNDIARLEEIQKQIKGVEALVDRINEQLQNTDYAQVTGEKAREWGELQATIEKLEEKLLGLYEEQENLSNT